MADTIREIEAHSVRNQNLYIGVFMFFFKKEPRQS